MLLGPHAPLVLEPRVRAVYAADAADFCKPVSLFPVVRLRCLLCLPSLLSVVGFGLAARRLLGGSAFALVERSSLEAACVLCHSCCSIGLLAPAPALLVVARVDAVPATQIQGKSTVWWYMVALHACYRELHSRTSQHQQPPGVGGKGEGRCQASAAAANSLTACQQLEQRREVGSLAKTSGSGVAAAPASTPDAEPACEPFCASVAGGASYAVFHSPMNKLVRKAWGRLAAFDHVLLSPQCRGLEQQQQQQRQQQGGVQPLPPEALQAVQAFSEAQRRAAAAQSSGSLGQQQQPTSHHDTVAADGGAQLDALERRADALLLAATAGSYERAVAPGAWAQVQLGNCYTASLYVGLAALVERSAAELPSRRVLLFAYGSGVAAAMFALRCAPGREPYTLAGMAAKV